MITYIKGDLFQVKSGVLGHACNYQGVWGGGIALLFKQKFPEAYRHYQQICKEQGENLVGRCILISENQYQIACLFTNDYSTKKQILKHTEDSLLDLKRQIPPHTVVNLPKINAGIFNVEWELTERVLERVDEDYNVYEL